MLSQLIGLLLMTAGPPDGAVTVTATWRDELREEGDSARLVVNAELSDGWKNDASGRLQPIVQLQVPKWITVRGKRLESVSDLAKNEFMQPPFEAMMRNGRVVFKLNQTGPAETDAHVEFNVTTFVQGASPEDTYFVRQRFAMPFSEHGVASNIDAADSSWGENDLLQLGDVAPDFELPRADGSTVTLSSFRGKKNVIITTYRAFW